MLQRLANITTADARRHILCHSAAYMGQDNKDFTVRKNRMVRYGIISGTVYENIDGSISQGQRKIL